MKMIRLILIGIMAMSLIGCGVGQQELKGVQSVQGPAQSTISSAEEASHDYYAGIPDEDSKLGALFYLGDREEEIRANQEMLKNNYFSQMDEQWWEGLESYTTQGGQEWFMIIPKYEQTNIKVYETGLDDEGKLQTGQLLWQGDEPLFLGCNRSDIVPDTQVVLTYGDRTVIFSPFINLKDGMPINIEGMIVIANDDSHLLTESDGIEDIK